jgi:hypothetical protein
MYGIVNKAIEELVIANFGEAKWDTVKAVSGIDVDYFISNEPYDDAITYQLAGAVASEMNMSVDEVLVVFGEWWILKTSKERYGSLMTAGGSDLRAFLLHLPDFHTRVMLMYPRLTPPEFQVSDVAANSICVHYYSQREGLQAFVRGLLQGLSKLYETETDIELIQSRDDGFDHEIFKVTWR